MFRVIGKKNGPTGMQTLKGTGKQTLVKKTKNKQYYRHKSDNPSTFDPVYAHRYQMETVLL